MYSVTNPSLKNAPVVELADTPVLETGLFGGTSSSLVRRTKKDKNVYSNVYDLGVLSTKKKGEGLVLLRKAMCNNLKNLHSSFRNQCRKA